MNINTLIQQLPDASLPPVDKWDPPFCGDMDMEIRADGSWWHEGSPIGRPQLIRLFSRILKREGERYFLVTPVEKAGIRVQDVPFVITLWQWQGNALSLTTQTGDSVIVGNEHPVELRPFGKEGIPVPYVRVRSNLWARLHQNIFYQLVEYGSADSHQGRSRLMLQSGEYRFSLGHLD